MQGGIKDHHIQPKVVTVYPNKNSSRCLILHFKQLASLRPVKDTTGALFLQPNNNWSAYLGCKWFNNAPLGHNTLSMMIKSLMETAGFEGTFSNHSGRRTAVSRIISATGDKEIAKKVTGHLSDSILTYNEVPSKKMKMVSNILSNSSEPCCSKSLASSVSSVSGDFITKPDEHTLPQSAAEFSSDSLYVESKNVSYYRQHTSQDTSNSILKKSIRITLPNGCLIEIPMDS